jgi:hypothetical protein
MTATSKLGEGESAAMSFAFFGGRDSPRPEFFDPIPFSVTAVSDRGIASRYELTSQSLTENVKPDHRWPTMFL